MLSLNSLSMLLLSVFSPNFIVSNLAVLKVLTIGKPSCQGHE